MLPTSQEIKIGLSRCDCFYFAQTMMPKFEVTKFHYNYYKILNEFAHQRIKKLIITVPPQHGKSQGSSVFLPAFRLGINPDCRIAIASYAASLSKKFNRHIQRILDTPEYQEIFPKTRMNASNIVTISRNYLRNANEFEVVNYQGSLRVVGRGGGLTGNTVDLMILDDLYKDTSEANSPVIRESAWDWYLNVAKTRLHNDSQELIVFTRWHEDDLIGRIKESEEVIQLKSFDDIKDLDQSHWLHVNFEALKESERTEIDDREIKDALWPNRHSRKFLLEKRQLDPVAFSCLYQGDPKPKEGLLYGQFKTYEILPPNAIKRANYTDTADEGVDYLCSIDYIKTVDKLIYIVDIVYTQEPMEKTEIYVSMMINKNGTKQSRVESNNGGRGFARAVKGKVESCSIEWFHQSGNKESRILTNASLVNSNILFPLDWQRRFPEFYSHITNYKKLFAANKHDDAPDTLTGIIETEFERRAKSNYVA